MFGAAARRSRFPHSTAIIYIMKQFRANLLSDRLGLGFNTALKAYLYIAFENVSDIIFEVVSSDLIKASIVANDGSISSAEFIFVRQNAVLVRHSKAYKLKCVFDGDVEYIRKGNTEIYTGENGTFALYSEENDAYSVSAFACGKNAPADAEEAFTTEVNREISGKLDFFAKLPIVEDMPKNISAIFGKSMSVLKSLAYSADGSFNGMWCTPSRLNGEKCRRSARQCARIQCAVSRPTLRNSALCRRLIYRMKTDLFQARQHPISRAKTSNRRYLRIKPYSFSSHRATFQFCPKALKN